MKKSILQVRFSEVIKRRYSVRKFSDEKVSEKLIEEILETGRVRAVMIEYNGAPIELIEFEKNKE